MKPVVPTPILNINPTANDIGRLQLRQGTIGVTRPLRKLNSIGKSIKAGVKDWEVARQSTSVYTREGLEQITITGLSK